MASEIKANKLSPATGTDVTLGDSGDTFTVPSGAIITNSGTASGFGLFSAYAILREEQSSGTNGSTPSGSGNWDTRVINTEIDPSSIVTLSSNEFTLAAGSYLINFWCSGSSIEKWLARLYDVTGAAVVTNGYSSAEDDGTAARTRNSVGHVRVAPGSSNAYKIQSAGSTIAGASLWGQATSLGTEVYLECIIYKEA